MKIFLDSVGCRLNQSEIEAFASQFHAAGHTLVAKPSEADLAIINTCSVTASAASDSRQKIRQVNRSGSKEIVVTGCWSSLSPEAASALPGVSQVVPNAGKDRLVFDLLNLPVETFDLEPVARQLVPGARLRTRAFIKVQDGCDNRCTFCVTTLARGSGRSRTVSKILADIESARQSNPETNSGAQEIVLTGVHLGSWGQDFSPALHLRHLVETILKETDVPRLRLSSVEPWDLDQEFFALWEDSRLCRHLHLPLQSGSITTLRRMARKTTPGSFARLVESARAACPELAITTDIIAGFPGESQTEFEESLAFVQEMDFAGGHVFTYSARAGTAAARMPDQVPYQIRKERNARLRAGLAVSSARYQHHFLGQVMEVLWENVTEIDAQSWQMSGLTDNYLRVHTRAPANSWNQITPVKLTRFINQGLEGQFIGLGDC
jgi:threonylcarbamoyladenosine tRNA methylthiotransferase MtaB